MTDKYSPATFAFKLKDGSDVSMSQYFYDRYKKELYDKQPLLFVNKPDGPIYLPAQLCNEASLPKDFTRDTRKMRDLQGYKITSAATRLEKIRKLVDKFNLDETFEEWGVATDCAPADVLGHKLEEPRVGLPGGKGTASMMDAYLLKHPLY